MQLFLYISSTRKSDIIAISVKHEKKIFKCGTKGSPIVLTAVIWVKKFVNWCTGVRIAGILVHTFIPKVTLQTKVTDELTTIF